MRLNTPHFKTNSPFLCEQMGANAFAI